MIIRYLLFITVFCLSNFLNSVAQNTLIASEDFEGISYIINPNDTGLGTNSGTNKWIINNLFNGGGNYPNTIAQDSTYGGLITFPNGHYLHIHDSVAATASGIANTNYDPQSESDRFAIVKEFCTLGFSDVTVAYYYLCMGDSTNAFGQAYYSINNGTWTVFPGAIYRNTYKWKYTELIDPIFDNQSNVRIGFRWTNNASNAALKPSFAIDDIRIVGNFDNSLVGITMDTLQLVPVCQNFNFLAYFNLTNPLCGSGFYQVELSNSVGNFSNPTLLGIYQLNNLSTFQELFLNIPSNTPPGNCYQIRIIRIDVTPNVTSNISACFVVLLCPNTIATLEPVMVSNPLDTICVGSVIDVPFFSTGNYTNNSYVAQLSDSAGNFPINPNVLGAFQNSQTYDPALGSLPGIIPGVLNPMQPIPAGCNYYIRVISINPAATSSLYGPFCIKNCDINSSNEVNIHACINSVLGFDTLLSININQYDSNAIYASTNLFQLQLLSSMNFGIVNTGGIGSINTNGDTIMPINIPNLGGLLALGLQPGLYYARIVANNSTTNWNNLGTLIRVIIGAPADIPLGVYGYNPNNFTGYIHISDTAICAGTAIYFTMLPYNSSSEYVWRLNQTNWSTDQYTGVLFNQSGNFFMSVVETNFGCVGASSDTAVITLLGSPVSAITGPSQVVINDTVTYSAALSNYNTYNWNCNNAVIVNENNNIFEMALTTIGNYQVSCTVTNMCTSSTSTKNITGVSGVGNYEINSDVEVLLLNNISDGLFQYQINEHINKKYSISVFQLNGTVIYDENIEITPNKQTYNFDLENAQSGVYYLKIANPKNIKIFKIVKV